MLSKQLGAVTAVAFVALIAITSCRKAPESYSASGDSTVPPASSATIQPTIPGDHGDASALSPRIPIDVAKEWIESGRVRVLDVRGSDDYMAGHIPGALHIPLSRLAGELPYLPRDKAILTYCT